ncbi:hypothetical protein BDR26DRAFT_853574, partial [Obelidium mucronatum]
MTLPLPLPHSRLRLPLLARIARRLAVNASRWLRDASAANCPFDLLSARCVKLMTIGVCPVLVFDHEDSFENSVFVELLDLLKFPWFVAAPGVKADAECASLSVLGYVDAVMTDDFDAFLFGAKMVIRNWCDTTHDDDSGSDSVVIRDCDDDDTDFVNLYSAQDIFDASDWNRNSFVVMTLLSGSGGAPGIRGIGIQTASQLAVSKFADLIVHASLSNDTNALKTHLATLFTQLQTNSLGLLTQKRPRVVRDLEALVEGAASSWPPRIRKYVFPDTRIDSEFSALHSPLLQRITSYMKSPFPAEHTPDTNSLLHWYTSNLNGCSTDAALIRIYGMVLPMLRIRHLERVASLSTTLLPRSPHNFFMGRKPVQEKSSEASSVSSKPPPSPKSSKQWLLLWKYPYSHGLEECLIDGIEAERESEIHGGQQVKVVWSDFAMHLNCPATALAGRNHGNDSTSEKESSVSADIHGTDATIDLIMSCSRKVWVDRELVAATYPQLLEEVSNSTTPSTPVVNVEERKIKVSEVGDGFDPFDSDAEDSPPPVSSKKKGSKRQRELNH